MTSTSRPAQQRARAAFVAAIVVLCQAAAWVHAAAIPHVTCLEHGESVHLPSQGKAAPMEGVATPATVDDATAHAHEHCNLQGHRTTRTAPVTVARALLAVEAPDLPGSQPARSPVTVLRFAPKTSPPRAAI